jgi:hypothetical protein
MEYVLGMVAAALLGAGHVLQQDAAQQARKAHFLRMQLLLGGRGRTEDAR